MGFHTGSAHFHYVEAGSPVISLPGGESHPLKPGDLALLPRTTSYLLQSETCPRPDTIFPLEGDRLTSEPSLLLPGEGDLTKMVSGTFGFDAMSASTLLQNLPELIVISRDDGANAEWLGTLAFFLLAEARDPRPGSAIMISRLIDVLVVQTLRAWVARHGGGWLGAIQDPGVERALAALHREPFRDWSLSDLAGLAIMSRSVFSDRFAAAVGTPPLRYIKHWRLAMAEDMLRTGTEKVGEVSRRIGYASEAAFSRAFKAHFGHPPVEARRTAPSKHRLSRPTEEAPDGHAIRGIYGSPAFFQFPSR